MNDAILLHGDRKVPPTRFRELRQHWTTQSNRYNEDDSVLLI